MSAFMPMGLGVSARMRRSPSRNSMPCTNASVTGWAMPMPPASLAAATSSTLLHGYIAPQMSGTAIPAGRVRGGSRRPLTAGAPLVPRARPSPRRSRHEPEPPVDAHRGHHSTAQVVDLGPHLVVGVAVHRGQAHPTLREQGSARLLPVLGLDPEHDAAHPGHH